MHSTAVTPGKDTHLSRAPCRICRLFYRQLRKARFLFHHQPPSLVADVCPAWRLGQVRDDKEKDYAGEELQLPGRWMCFTHGSWCLHDSPPRPESTPPSSQWLYCGQLISSIMMPFVTNLAGLKMNCSCCSFHLCRIATRAESQLITFSPESGGPFVPSSAECVMEKGARQAAAGQLGIA